MGTETSSHQNQPRHQIQLRGGSSGDPARSQEVPRRSCRVPQAPPAWVAQAVVSPLRAGLWIGVHTQPHVPRHTLGAHVCLEQGEPHSHSHLG